MKSSTAPNFSPKALVIQAQHLKTPQALESALAGPKAKAVGPTHMSASVNMTLRSNCQWQPGAFGPTQEVLGAAALTGCHLLPLTGPVCFGRAGGTLPCQYSCDLEQSLLHKSSPQAPLKQHARNQCSRSVGCSSRSQSPKTLNASLLRDASPTRNTAIRNHVPVVQTLIKLQSRMP